MNKSSKTLLSILVLSALIVPVVILAAAPDVPPTKNWDDIKSFITSAIYTVGGLVVIVAALVAGILFITSGGDAEKVKTARMALIWAVAGAGVLIVAASLWTIIKGWA